MINLTTKIKQITVEHGKRILVTSDIHGYLSYFKKILEKASFSDKDIARVKFDHRLSMAAENIIGLILEEYIHVNALKYGWSCCWGNSIKAVDFCSSDGKLLQVKNKSNTENSSSNKIRQGTEIIKWFRLNANNGNTNWDTLNTIIGKPALLSEVGFERFAEDLIKKNPNALYLDEETFLKVYN